MCPAVRVSVPRTTGRTADVRAGEGRLGGGRGSASTVLRATTKRSRRRAALRSWGTGPDSTGSSRSVAAAVPRCDTLRGFCRRSNRPDDELLPRP